MLAIQALTYIETTKLPGPFRTIPQEINQIALSNSTAEKCAPSQVVKQPEYGRASTTEGQNCPSFQTNYD